MDDQRPDDSVRPGVVPDLVEYFVVVVEDLDSLASLAPAVAELVEQAAIRILDLVVVAREADGTVVILEPEAVASLETLADLEGEIGGLLSDHDIELVALALDPGMVGLVVVTEDRWADGLSRAARRAGGQIIAGERIPASRVQAALADRSTDEGLTPPLPPGSG
jgi:hypothetical protein